LRFLVVLLAVYLSSSLVSHNNIFGDFLDLWLVGGGLGLSDLLGKLGSFFSWDLLL